MYYRALKTTLSLSIIFASVSLLIYTTVIRAEPSTVLLSDHKVTGETPGAWPQLVAVTTGITAHVVWDEATGTNEGEDLFYRQLPFGSTQNISDQDATEGGISKVYIDSAANGEACAVWVEVAEGTEGTNLYFWRSADGQTKELTDNNLTWGNVKEIELVCKSNEAYVIWQEIDNGQFYEELFYWQESTNVTSVLSNLAESIGDVTHAKLVVEQGVAYVAWAEWIGDSSTGIFHPFYWNSETNTVLDMGPGVPENLYFFVDNNKVSHLVWLEYIGNPSTDSCAFYWNSQDAVKVNISQNPTNCESFLLTADMGKDQEIHATWVHLPSSSANDEAVYWNTQLSTPSIITTTNSLSDYSKLLVDQNGTAFVTWSNLFAREDFYIWDSATQTIKNISDPVSGAGEIDGVFQWAADENGDVHILWNEESCNSCSENKDWLFYHRVNDGSTVRLFAPLGDEDNVTAQVLTISPPGTAHVAWTEQTSGAGADELILYWDSVSQNVQEVGAASNPSSLQMVTTVPGQPQLAWLDWLGTPEQENVYFWNETEGIVELTDESATEGYASDLLLIANGVDSYYALWVEEANPGEGNDIFGAWEEISLPNKVFLPVVLRE